MTMFGKSSASDLLTQTATTAADPRSEVIAFDDADLSAIASAFINDALRRMGFYSAQYGPASKSLTWNIGTMFVRFYRYNVISHDVRRLDRLTCGKALEGVRASFRADYNCIERSVRSQCL
jgi:hypothetical protein